MKALLDTSVFIGVERRGVRIANFDSAAVSTMTLAELALGAAMASDPDEYAIRRHTLLRVRERFDVIGFSIAAAEAFGAAVARMRRAGRRPSVADSVVAATAIAGGYTLVTQDRGFLAFDGLDVVLV